MEYLCNNCPRMCNAVRAETGGGVCRMGAEAVVARAAPHFDEEPVISGTKGSGTVFFSGCNLHCVFCQNYDISCKGFGKEITIERLKEIYHELIAQGAHNINLVTPTHFTEAVLQSLAEPLPVPVVYNTSGINVAELKVDEAATEAKIVKMYPAHDAQPIENAADGTDVAVICDVTAFHAEGGGQLGDIGTITASTGVIAVNVTKKLPDGAVIMIGSVTEGTVAVGDAVTFAVDKARKMDIARNHTATHLLHAALKQVLGAHVNQAGSYVGPDRLRFDFSHFSQVTAEELKEVEAIVNEQVLAGKAVNIEELPIEEAKKKGATALFGEKYGNIVRVVTVPDFSMEFCGGSHVSNTAQIGMFKIVSEGSSGAGVRRIEAVTGHGAVAHVNATEEMVNGLAAELKCRCCDVPTRLEALQCELKAAQKKAEELAAEIAKAQVSNVADQIKDANGVPVLVQKVNADSVDALRNLGDQMRDKVGGVVVLAAVMGEKVSILTMATKDAVAKGVHAGNIVKAVAKLCGGGGGGRPDMAQAGAKDVAKVDEALAAAFDIVAAMVK